MLSRTHTASRDSSSMALKPINTHTGRPLGSDGYVRFPSDRISGMPLGLSEYRQPSGRWSRWGPRLYASSGTCPRRGDAFGVAAPKRGPAPVRQVKRFGNGGIDIKTPRRIVRASATSIRSIRASTAATSSLREDDGWGLKRPQDLHACTFRDHMLYSRRIRRCKPADWLSGHYIHKSL